MNVLAVDAGTTGVTALLVTPDGAVAGRGYREFPTSFPRPGWVEQDPEQIWAAVLAACAEATGGSPPPTAVGLTNQRETAVFWHRRSLAPVRAAIVWQDRRSTDVCDRLAGGGQEQLLRARTGLRSDPYFTATKLAWVAAHDPDTWAGVRSGRVAVGTVDSYLLARLTAGACYATDPSNASRTLLYDLSVGGWSAELCDLFDVPVGVLAEVRPSSGQFGWTDPETFAGWRLPVAGVAGDQQAALFGQLCHQPGDAKCTYGTGSFVLCNTGSHPVRSTGGLLTTVAWDLGGGRVYAVEGAIFVTGAAVQWLRDGLGLLGEAAEVERLAGSVPDSGGVVFVPALTGLGAPHWDPQARGALFGVTRGTGAGQLARATLEAIAFQVRDVLDVMLAETGLRSAELSVDGGAAGNDLLCEIQAAVLQRPVRRPRVRETTALGAAFLAGLATGVWASTAELATAWRLDRSFPPGADDPAAYRRWRSAVQLTRDWARLAAARIP